MESIWFNFLGVLFFFNSFVYLFFYIIIIIIRYASEQLYWMCTKYWLARQQTTTKTKQNWKLRTTQQWKLELWIRSNRQNQTAGNGQLCLRLICIRHDAWSANKCKLFFKSCFYFCVFPQCVCVFVLHELLFSLSYSFVIHTGHKYSLENENKFDCKITRAHTNTAHILLKPHNKKNRS